MTPEALFVFNNSISVRKTKNNRDEINMVKRFSKCIILFIILSSQAHSQVLSQWRGPNRDGIYPGKNLLKKWQEGGPELLWSYKGLGAGHGTVAIANNNIYVAGMPDSLGVLYAFNKNGKLLWKKVYGLEWNVNYPGVRSTPTIVNNYLYLESGQGHVFCFDASNGKQIWSVDLLKKFNAKNIKWGMAESLLIDGDRIFCTPGGSEHNVVALNRFTGETIWTSKGYGEPAAYCSPILINHNNTRLIVTMTAESIIGIDANTGEFYWRVPQNQTNKIHANTPLYLDGKVLCSSSSAKKSDHGIVLLQLDKDGKNAHVLWRNEEFTNLIGGIIIKDGYIYGARYHKSEWCCLDLNTGDIQYVSKELDDGAITYADGLFYCYSEKGEFALVDANPKAFKVISSFTVPLGTDQHWAHPVIKDGRLYIRHGDSLMAFNVSQ